MTCMRSSASSMHMFQDTLKHWYPYRCTSLVQLSTFIIHMTCNNCLISPDIVQYRCTRYSDIELYRYCSRCSTLRQPQLQPSRQCKHSARRLLQLDFKRQGSRGPGWLDTIVSQVVHRYRDNMSC